MNQKEVNFLSMCRSVQQVLDTNQTSLTSVPAIRQQHAIFAQLMKELSVAAEDAELRSGGVTEQKQDAEQQAIHLAVNLAKRASVYALDVSDFVLHDQLRVSKTALLQRPDNLTLAKLRDIYTRVQLLSAELSDYGITGDDLTKLNNLNNAFEQLISKPRTTIVERKGYNQEQIPELIADIRLCLYKLDSMMNLFAGSDLARAYKSARMIIDLGSRPEPEDTKEAV